MPDLQAAWLLLLFCGAPRCIYLLRVLPPSSTLQFAQTHDAAVLSCLEALLVQEGGEEAAALQAPQRRRAHLPLRRGGLGLRSAVQLRPAAFWASWADTLPMIRQRHPHLADQLLGPLEGSSEGST